MARYPNWSERRLNPKTCRVPLPRNRSFAEMRKEEPKDQNASILSLPFQEFVLPFQDFSLFRTFRFAFPGLERESRDGVGRQAYG